MNRKISSGTAMFMMEMIIVVFFFILCASTCIRIFVMANQMSSLANDTNRGVVGAESIVEVWKAEGAEGLKTRLSAKAVSGAGEAERYEVYWDAEWNIIGNKEDASYQGNLVWERKEENRLHEARVTVARIRDDVQLFELQTKKYSPVWE